MCKPTPVTRNLLGVRARAAWLGEESAFDLRLFLLFFSQPLRGFNRVFCFIGDMLTCFRCVQKRTVPSANWQGSLVKQVRSNLLDLNILKEQECRSHKVLCCLLVLIGVWHSAAVCM